MAYPPITSLGTVPQRTQTPAEFATNADSFLGALPNFRTELNTFGAYVDDAGVAIDADTAAAANSALQSANSASASDASAALALSYKDLAAGAANFKGSWSALTGSLAVPASVYHNSLTWVLLSNLANVATAEPGVSASWVVASGDSYRRLVDNIFKRATLDLDFSANSHKVYEQFGLEPKQLQSVVVTSRNSTATYQSPTGLATAAINTPRITYDAATGNALGLLVEEQRTNILLHSQYTAASGETPPTGWTIGTNTGVTTTAASPRFAGAIRATQSGVSAREFYERTLTLSAATTYTLSVFFADGTTVDGVCIGFVTADTLTGTTSLLGSNVVAGRVNSITFTTSAGGNVTVRIGLGVGGNATGTVIHETPQLEVGPAATSYIPTTTAQVTRVADVIPRALTTTNANAGSIFIEFDLLAAIPAGFTTSIIKIIDSANTLNRGFALRLTGSIFESVIRNDTVSASAAITVIDALSSKKALISFDNDAKKLLISIDGISNEIAIASAVDLAAYMSHLFVAGASGISGTFAPHSKTVKRCTYFPRSFTAAEAQAITA